MITISFKGLNTISWSLQAMDKQWPDAMAGATQTAANYLLPYLEGTTNNWKHKAKFSVVIPKRLTKEISIETDHEVWNMLDRGTRAHRITAHNPSGRLWFFAGGFVPKTYPGVLYSGPGTAAYYDFRSPQSVNHPGTKARKWSEQVTSKYGVEAVDKAQKHMDAALEAALRQEGRWATTDWLNSWGK